MIRVRICSLNLKKNYIILEKYISMRGYIKRKQSTLSVMSGYTRFLEILWQWQIRFDLWYYYQGIIALISKN